MSVCSEMHGMAPLQFLYYELHGMELMHFNRPKLDVVLEIF